MNPPDWHTYRPHPSAADRIAAGPAVNLRLVTHGQPLLGQAPRASIYSECSKRLTFSPTRLWRANTRLVPSKAAESEIGRGQG
jgi:hypothetical protein